MKTSDRVLLMLTLSAALAGCSDSDTVYPPGTPPETVRVAFQDGAYPSLAYDGTRDAAIKDGPTNDQRNRCYGRAAADTIGWLELAGEPYERRLLVKTDLSGITDCGTVVAASLSLRLSAPADSITLELLRVSRPDYSTWAEGTPGIATGVSWTTVDGAEPWLLEGGDTDGIVLARARVAGDTTVALRLPPLVVKEWITTPAKNHGVMIRSGDPGAERFALARLREAVAAGDRPRVDVAYLRGG